MCPHTTDTTYGITQSRRYMCVLILLDTVYLSAYYCIFGICVLMLLYVSS
jgi:hypothetical protein